MLNRSVGDYTPQRWHGTLLVIVIGTLFMFVITFFARRLPLLQLLTLPVHVLGLVALVVPLWLLVLERRSVRDALFDFRNGGVWSSAGVAAMVGIRGPLQTMLSYDCAAQMGKIPPPPSAQNSFLFLFSPRSISSLSRRFCFQLRQRSFTPRLLSKNRRWDVKI